MKKKYGRHKCLKCGATRKEELMERVNDWHQGQWLCLDKRYCACRADYVANGVYNK